MKRLAFTIVGVLVLILLAAVGCAEQEPADLTPAEGEEVVSSCVSCHTDKDTLKEVASPEAEEVHSEATSGEG